MKYKLITHGLQLTQFSKLEDYTRHVYSENARIKDIPKDATITYESNSDLEPPPFDPLRVIKKPNYDRDDHSNFAFIPFFGLPQLQSRSTHHLSPLNPATIDFLERATNITILMYLIPRLEDSIIEKVIPVLLNLLLTLPSARRSVSKELHNLLITSPRESTLSKRKYNSSFTSEIQFIQRPNAHELIQQIHDILTPKIPLILFPFFTSTIQEFILFNMQYQPNGSWFNQDITEQDAQFFIRNIIENKSFPSRLQALIPHRDNRDDFYYNALLKRQPELTQENIQEWWHNHQLIIHSPLNLPDILTKKAITSSSISLDSDEIGELQVKTRITSGTIKQDINLNINTLREPVLIRDKEVKHFTFVLDAGASLGSANHHNRTATHITPWQHALKCLMNIFNQLKSQPDYHCFVTLILFRKQAKALRVKTPIDNVTTNLVHDINKLRQSLGHLTHYQSFLPLIKKNNKVVLITDGNAHDNQKVLQNKLSKLTCQWLLCHIAHDYDSKELLPLFVKPQSDLFFSFNPTDILTIPPLLFHHANTVFENIQLRIQLYTNQNSNLVEETHPINLTGQTHHIHQQIKGSTLTRIRLWVDGDEAHCENNYLCSRASKSKTSNPQQSNRSHVGFVLNCVTP